MTEREIATGTDALRVAVADGIGSITFNRPERRNALHAGMYEPAMRALAEFANDDDVGCVVLTGSGSSFCAGGDVKDGQRHRAGSGSPTIEQRAARLLADAQLSRMLHESAKVTIAAVNGPAVGAGMSLALACDFRIMARSASLTPGWARLAFSGDFGGTWFLTRLVGPSKALELVVANTTTSADDAVALGLANAVVDDSDFDARWREWAGIFARGPRDAVALMKANVHQALVEPLATALASESERMVRSSLTVDHKEAVRAWLDKREPDFRR